MSNVIKLSLVSGFFAASAAGLGKLATSPSIYEWLVDSFAGNETFLHQTIIRGLQFIFFILMFITNTVMWSQFSMALSLSQTTIFVIVINTMSNFICTAIIGFLLFGEIITLTWTLGIVCLLIGIFLLKEQAIYCETSVKNDNNKEKVN